MKKILGTITMTVATVFLVTVVTMAIVFETLDKED